MFPTLSPFLGLCMNAPLLSDCCWDSLERVNDVGKGEGKLCESRTSRWSLWCLSAAPRDHLSWPLHCWAVVQLDGGS